MLPSAASFSHARLSVRQIGHAIFSSIEMKEVLRGNLPFSTRSENVFVSWVRRRSSKDHFFFLSFFRLPPPTPPFTHFHSSPFLTGVLFNQNERKEASETGRSAFFPLVCSARPRRSSVRPLGRSFVRDRLFAQRRRPQGQVNGWMRRVKMTRSELKFDYRLLQSKQAAVICWQVVR